MTVKTKISTIQSPPLCALANSDVKSVLQSASLQFTTNQTGGSFRSVSFCLPKRGKNFLFGVVVQTVLEQSSAIYSLAWKIMNK